MIKRIDNRIVLARIATGVWCLLITDQVRTLLMKRNVTITHMMMMIMNMVVVIMIIVMMIVRIGMIMKMVMVI